MSYWQDDAEMQNEFFDNINKTEQEQFGDLDNKKISEFFTLKKEVFPDHQCKTENGIESDEKFIIVDIIGNYEQLQICNQYKQYFIVNPSQLKIKLKNNETQD